MLTWYLNIAIRMTSDQSQFTRAQVTLVFLYSVSVQDICHFCSTLSHNVMPEDSALLQPSTVILQLQLNRAYTKCFLSGKLELPTLECTCGSSLKGRLHSSNRCSLRHSPPCTFIYPHLYISLGLSLYN